MPKMEEFGETWVRKDSSSMISCSVKNLIDLLQNAAGEYTANWNSATSAESETSHWCNHVAVAMVAR